MLAPKAVIGFHASRWAGDAASMVSFLNGIGAGEADLIVQDMLDRDAGCFEAHVDSQCQRNDGPWYWDEPTRRRPTFTSTSTGRRRSATACTSRSSGGRCRSACPARRRAATPATTATTASTTSSATSASSSRRRARHHVRHRRRQPDLHHTDGNQFKTRSRLLRGARHAAVAASRLTTHRQGLQRASPADQSQGPTPR